MKIRLLKDIPGYKKGEITDLTLKGYGNYYALYGKDSLDGAGDYSVNYLIGHGWAEEVKEEVDIENDRDWETHNKKLFSSLNITPIGS